MFFFFMYLFRFLSYLSGFKFVQKLQALIWRFAGQPMVDFVKFNREARDKNIVAFEEHRKKKKEKKEQ